MDERIEKLLLRAGAAVPSNRIVDGEAGRRAIEDLVDGRMTTTYKDGNVYDLERIELMRRAIEELAKNNDELTGIVDDLTAALEGVLDRFGVYEHGSDEEKRLSELINSLLDCYWGERCETCMMFGQKLNLEEDRSCVRSLLLLAADLLMDFAGVCG